MQKVRLQGNLGSDPEVRFTQDGKEVVSFRIACNQRNPKTPDKPKTTWYRCTIFNNDRNDFWLAERAKELEKGNAVLVAGTLDIGEFERQDGSKGTSLDVRFIEELYVLRPRAAREVDAAHESDDEPSSEERRQPAASGANRRQAGAASAPADDDDLADLPF
jgi:single stranded DNA-binding protein